MTDLYIDEAARVMALATLKRIFVERGCTRLYYKRLAANDNSKNQIYLGGSPEDTRAIPTGHWTRIRGESKKGAPTGERYILQAPVDLHWMKPDGGISPAKQTKMILYPQYGAAGEFRLSGFLDGAVDRPSTLLQHTRRGREPGRILFFGTDNEKKVFCFLAPADARSAREISTEQPIETVGLLTGLSLPAAAPQVATREALLTVLGTVNRQGWTESKILHSRNGVRPCKGPQVSTAILSDGS